MAKEIELWWVIYLIWIKYINNPFTWLMDAIETITKKPLYVSHFNTTDWTNNALVSNKSTTSRYIANPWTYDIWDWNAWDSHWTLRWNFSVSVANKCSFIDDSTTTFTVKVFWADGTTVLFEETTAEITWDWTYSLTNASISVSWWTTNEDKFAWNVSTTINIEDVIPEWWRFSYEIIHNNWSEWTFNKIQSDIYYDNEVNTAAMTWVTLTSWAEIIRQLSWVNYADTWTEFQVEIWDIDYLNWISYPWTQVKVYGSELWLPELSLSGSDLTWWTNDCDDIDDTYLKSDWAINGSLCTVWSKKINARTYDWAYWSYVDSNLLDIAINTIDDNSTRIYEHFTGEASRLESDFTTSWDSTRDLTNWELQVWCSKLFYPTQDYTSILPDTATQPNYDWLTGTRYYYRKMTSWGDDHSNWIFSLSWFTETDITDDNIIFWVSYNGTDFYNMNEDYGWGELNNWDGCRVEPDVYNMTDNWQIKFTFWSWGSWNTCYIKIEMPEWSTIQLDKIHLTDWNN